MHCLVSGTLYIFDFEPRVRVKGRLRIAGIVAGQTKEQVQAATAFKGFDDFGSISARLTLGFVLGVAYDEATDKR